MLLNCGAGEDSWEFLGCKEIKPVYPKGNQPWIFIRRTDAEAPIFWPPDVKSQLIGKDPDARKDWGQEEKWVREDEILDGITNSINGLELDKTPGDSEGQGSLACCSSWGCKESVTTEQLNDNNNLNPFKSCMRGQDLPLQREKRKLSLLLTVRSLS